MSEKFRIRKIQLGMFYVWALYHSSLLPMGRRYYFHWSDAIKRATR